MKATEDKPKAKILREDSDDDFFIELCLKGSKDLRDKLGADEQIFYSHPAHLSNPREYYLYSVLNEIEKAGTTLMRIREFASEGEVDDSHSAKNIIEAQLDETYLWLRKLTEILVELMLFKTTNEVDYYRHYIIIQHLKELNHTIENGKNAYACTIQNYISQTNDLKEKINGLEDSTVNLDKCWYLERKRDGSRTQGKKAKLANFKTKFDEALLLANPDQLISLRRSYNESFGSYSGSIHFNMDNRERISLSLDDVRKNASGIGLLAASILLVCRRLLKDRRRSGYVASLNKTFSNNLESKKIIQDQIKSEIKIGDFINAQRGLGEVIKINKSKFGYRSFRFKYLCKPSISDQLYEEYPAIFVQKLYDRKQVVAQTMKLILDGNPKKPVSARTVNKYVRKSVIDVWQKYGLKERIAGRPDLAKKKIEESLKLDKIEFAERIKSVD